MKKPTEMMKGTVAAIALAAGLSAAFALSTAAAAQAAEALEASVGYYAGALISLPALVAKRFAKSRIAAFSTGNVYGLCPLHLGGSLETDEPRPVGEYAMSCLGRERMFEHAANAHGTRVSILRLNYACEVRYGVDFPLTEKVHVKGDAAHPLFQWLAARGGYLSRPRWNFYKYLIGRDGRLVDWFASVTRPDSARFGRAVDRLLG